MSTTSARIERGAVALADHIAECGAVRFRDMFDYLESLGIPTSGHEDLMGEHVFQPHVGYATTLRDSLSSEVVEIVTALFRTRPLMLEIGDPASFACGDEPWWVTWTERRDALVHQAVEFVRDQGAVDFIRMTEMLQSQGVAIHGGMRMMLGRHPVGNGVTILQVPNPRNVVLWNCGSAELVSLLELVLGREPRVVLERTYVDHYRLSAMRRLENYTGDACLDQLPAIDFGAVAADGYDVPTWLPVMFAWSDEI